MPQRYERISDNDHVESPESNHAPHPIPLSPPPSFRSRASSPTSRHLLSSEDPLTSDADRTLADTFDDGAGSDTDEDHDGDDRQRLMRGNVSPPPPNPVSVQGDRPAIQRAVTQLPVPTPTTPSIITTTARGGTRFASSNDGVFANLNAKPERGEKTEDHPPTYEQAAADNAPPYWETTILAPGVTSDEVYVDGMPVGSLFSFVWNGMISMSFQLVGFLLTYLLHTTHAAKNGSRAGLGIMLIQYGFYMKGSNPKSPTDTDPQYGTPQDPNSHDFDPSTMTDSAAAAVAAMAASQGEQVAATSSSGISSIASSEWLAYVFMVVGWFILIRAVSDYLKARRHEQLVLQSPDRGLHVPVVAENEHPETVV